MSAKLVYQEGKQIQGEYFIVSIYDDLDASRITIRAYSLESGITSFCDNSYSAFDSFFRFNTNLLTPSSSDARYHWTVDHLHLSDDPLSPGSNRLFITQDLSSKDTEANPPQSTDSPEDPFLSTEQARKAFFENLNARLITQKAQAEKILARLEPDPHLATNPPLPIVTAPLKSEVVLAVEKILNKPKKIAVPLKAAAALVEIPPTETEIKPTGDRNLGREDRLEEIFFKSRGEIDRRLQISKDCQKTAENEKLRKLHVFVALKEAARLRVHAKRERAKNESEIDKRRHDAETLRERLRSQLELERQQQLKLEIANVHKAQQQRIKDARNRKNEENKSVCKQKQQEKKFCRQLECKRLYREVRDAKQPEAQEVQWQQAKAQTVESRPDLTNLREHRLVQKEKERWDDHLKRISSQPISLALQLVI